VPPRRRLAPHPPTLAEPLTFPVSSPAWRKKGTSAKPATPHVSTPHARGRPSALLDTRVVHCGDRLEQLRNLPDACVDLVYIDPPPVCEAESAFHSNRAEPS
jgi:hypothetical protein